MRDLTSKSSFGRSALDEDVNALDFIACDSAWLLRVSVEKPSTTWTYCDDDDKPRVAINNESPLQFLLRRDLAILPLLLFIGGIVDRMVPLLVFKVRSWAR